MINFFDYENATPVFTLFVALVYLINFGVAIGIIYSERKDPGATMAWILVLFLVPVLGLALYFFFSQNISKWKIFKLTKREEYKMTSSLEKQEGAIRRGDFDYDNEEARIWHDLILLNQNYGRAYYTQDNRYDIITNGNDLMDRLLADIKGAKESVHVMFFIVKPDEAGRMLLDVLTEKAREGVKVRLLVDALGSRHISNRFVREFTRAGGEFARFFPPRLWMFRYINPKLNFRNHRKLVVIDDVIGYNGGYNIAKEYLGKKKKFGNWRDTHMRIEGGAVQDINFRFLMDWRASVKEEVPVTDVFFPPESTKGNVGMQVVSAGPDSEHEQIKRAFLKMITAAEETIDIQTPYFVPDAPILEALKMAANSGVRVRIMIPCQPDHIFVYWATWSYCGDILRNGGQVFIYDDGFLHAKTLTADGQVGTIGSTNFDYRSFRLNFECNTFLYGATAVKKMTDVFEEDLKHCHELTPELYDNRSRVIKLKEPIGRLVSNIL